MASGPIKPGFVQDYEEKKQQENANKIKQERLKAKQEKQRQKELKCEQPVENTNKNQKTIILCITGLVIVIIGATSILLFRKTNKHNSVASDNKVSENSVADISVDKNSESDNYEEQLTEEDYIQEAKNYIHDFRDYIDANEDEEFINYYVKLRQGGFDDFTSFSKAANNTTQNLRLPEEYIDTLLSNNSIEDSEITEIDDAIKQLPSIPNPSQILDAEVNQSNIQEFNDDNAEVAEENTEYVEDEDTQYNNTTDSRKKSCFLHQ